MMFPPFDFTHCNSAYDTEFDENYAAPGTVVQDPTRPTGNLIMLYEAENDCPGGIHQHRARELDGAADDHEFRACNNLVSQQRDPGFV
jgi:hypothetical protein